MPAINAHIERLAAAQRWTYRASRHSATEPAAWAALALAAHGQLEAAARPAAWLASLQQADGSVGVSAADKTPCWPTSLALWAWAAIDAAHGTKQWQPQAAAAASWALANRGKSAPRSVHIGHNTELAGWSWAADTHSWLEPTCMFVLGLRAAGYSNHPRVREGVRLIVDRLLPEGGANYGNTIVLGQPLVPHVQPTGLAMVALADELVEDSRIAKSLDYLAATIQLQTAAPSLAFACMGLKIHGRLLTTIDELVARALDRGKATPTSPHELALLLLASAPASMLSRMTSSIEAAL